VYHSACVVIDSQAAWINGRPQTIRRYAPQVRGRLGYFYNTMRHLAQNNNVIFKLITIVIVCLFAVNNFSIAAEICQSSQKETLSPTSRLDPLVKIIEQHTKDGKKKFIVVENKAEMAKLQDDFLQNTGFLLISQILGQALKLSDHGLSLRGTKKLLDSYFKGYFEKQFKPEDYRILKESYKWNKLRKDGNAFVLPYIRFDDKEVQLLRYALAGDKFASDVIMHVGDVIVSLDTTLEKEVSSQPKSGNLIGKLYRDKEGKELVTEGIKGVEQDLTRETYLVLYQEIDGKRHDLYTKDGKPAKVIVWPTKVQGVKAIKDKGNHHILGFATKDMRYVSESMFGFELTVFHEEMEQYFADPVNKDKLPEGVNSHTMIRGCGKDIRRLLMSRKRSMAKYDAEKLIKLLKENLPEERHNEAEFALIRHNEKEGKKGIELIYGEQDKEFGPVLNESILWTEVCWLLFDVINKRAPQGFDALEKWMIADKQDIPFPTRDAPNFRAVENKMKRRYGRDWNAYVREKLHFARGAITGKKSLANWRQMARVVFKADHGKWPGERQLTYFINYPEENNGRKFPGQKAMEEASGMNYGAIKDIAKRHHGGMTRVRSKLGYKLEGVSLKSRAKPLSDKDTVITAIFENLYGKTPDAKELQEFKASKKEGPPPTYEQLGSDVVTALRTYYYQSVSMFLEKELNYTPPGYLGNPRNFIRELYMVLNGEQQPTKENLDEFALWREPDVRGIRLSVSVVGERLNDAAVKYYGALTGVADWLGFQIKKQHWKEGRPEYTWQEYCRALYKFLYEDQEPSRGTLEAFMKPFEKGMPFPDIDQFPEPLKSDTLKRGGREVVARKLGFTFKKVRYHIWEEFLAELKDLYMEYGYTGMWDKLSYEAKKVIADNWHSQREVLKRFIASDPMRFIPAIAGELATKRYFSRLSAFHRICEEIKPNDKVKQAFNSTIDAKGTTLSDRIDEVAQKRKQIEDVLKKYGLEQEQRDRIAYFTGEEIFELIKKRTYADIKTVVTHFLYGDKEQRNVVINRMILLSTKDSEALAAALTSPLKEGGLLEKVNYEGLLWAFSDTAFGRTIIGNVHIENIVSSLSQHGYYSMRAEHGDEEGPQEGDAIGKFYYDRGARELVTEGITAREEKIKRGEFLVFYRKDTRKRLYTRDGNIAKAGIKERRRKDKITILKRHPYIYGFATKKEKYVTRDFLDDMLVRHHEDREHYFALHPDELPEEVNSHTYIRGCGKDIRLLLKEKIDEIADFSGHELIEFLKQELPPERHNPAEFALIQYNSDRGKKGISLIYGEQDEDESFGPAVNESIKWTQLCWDFFKVVHGRFPDDYKELGAWMEKDKTKDSFPTKKTQGFHAMEVRLHTLYGKGAIAYVRNRLKYSKGRMVGDASLSHFREIARVVYTAHHGKWPTEEKLTYYIEHPEENNDKEFPKPKAFLDAAGITFVAVKKAARMHHGYLRGVTKVLGYKTKYKIPRGYWKDKNNVIREIYKRLFGKYPNKDQLKRYITGEKTGTPPTYIQLGDAICSSLRKYFHRSVSQFLIKELGYEYPVDLKIPENFLRELYKDMHDNKEPTDEEFEDFIHWRDPEERGVYLRRDSISVRVLYAGQRHYGGIRAIADWLGFKITRDNWKQKPRYNWREYCIEIYKYLYDGEDPGERRLAKFMGPKPKNRYFPSLDDLPEDLRTDTIIRGGREVVGIKLGFASGENPYDTWQKLYTELKMLYFEYGYGDMWDRLPNPIIAAVNHYWDDIETVKKKFLQETPKVYLPVIVKELSQKRYYRMLKEVDDFCRKQGGLPEAVQKDIYNTEITDGVTVELTITKAMREKQDVEDTFSKYGFEEELKWQKTYPAEREREKLLAELICSTIQETIRFMISTDETQNKLAINRLNFVAEKDPVGLGKAFSDSLHTGNIAERAEYEGAFRRFAGTPFGRSIIALTPDGNKLLHFIERNGHMEFDLDDDDDDDMKKPFNVELSGESISYAELDIIHEFDGVYLDYSPADRIFFKVNKNKAGESAKFITRILGDAVEQLVLKMKTSGGRKGSELYTAFVEGLNRHRNLSIRVARNLPQNACLYGDRMTGGKAVLVLNHNFVVNMEDVMWPLAERLHHELSHSDVFKEEEEELDEECECVYRDYLLYKYILSDARNKEMKEIVDDYMDRMNNRYRSNAYFRFLRSLLELNDETAKERIQAYVARHYRNFEKGRKSFPADQDESLFEQKTRDILAVIYKQKLGLAGSGYISDEAKRAFELLKAYVETRAGPYQENWVDFINALKQLEIIDEEAVTWLKEIKNRQDQMRALYVTSKYIEIMEFGCLFHGTSTNNFADIQANGMRIIPDTDFNTIYDIYERVGGMSGIRRIPKDLCFTYNPHVALGYGYKAPEAFRLTLGVAQDLLDTDPRRFRDGIGPTPGERQTLQRIVSKWRPYYDSHKTMFLAVPLKVMIEKGCIDEEQHDYGFLESPEEFFKGLEFLKKLYTESLDFNNTEGIDNAVNRLMNSTFGDTHTKTDPVTQLHYAPEDVYVYLKNGDEWSLVRMSDANGLEQDILRTGDELRTLRDEIEAESEHQRQDMFYQARPLEKELDIRLRDISVRKLIDIETVQLPDGMQEDMAQVKKNEAIDFVDAVIMRAGKAERLGEKVIIGLDTSWIPSEQQSAIQGLFNSITAISKTKRLKNIAIVRGNGLELAGKIRDEMGETDKYKVRESNIIVIGEQDILKNNDFNFLRPADKDFDEWAFFAGIKLPADFPVNSYLRILEMMTLAAGLAFGESVSSKSVEMKQDEDNPRFFYFIPQAEPLKLEVLRKVYELQRDEVKVRA